MHIKKVRQILKSFADDTRLRIINLLNHRELNVGELCRILRKKQSNVSKHLSRLRLTGIVGDKRGGLNVYYYLIKWKDKACKGLIDSITSVLAELPIFKQDLARLKGLKKTRQV